MSDGKKKEGGPGRGSCSHPARGDINLHSRNAAAKLMQTAASQLRTPRFWAVWGMEAVCISSSLVRTPAWERKPTTILGTPSRCDWIQNRISLRSNPCIPRSSRISALVFSSTQFVAAPFSAGFESHTACPRSARTGPGRAVGVSILQFPMLRGQYPEVGKWTYWHLPRLRDIRQYCRSPYGQRSNTVPYY